MATLSIETVSAFNLVIKRAKSNKLIKMLFNDYRTLSCVNFEYLPLNTHLQFFFKSCFIDIREIAVADPDFELRWGPGLVLLAL